MITIRHYNTKFLSSLRNRPFQCQPRIRLKVARPLLAPVAKKLCNCKQGVFTSKTCSFSKNYFASKSSAVYEAFSNAYPDSEVPSKTTMHRLMFRDTGSVWVSSKRRWTFSASPIKLLSSTKQKLKERRHQLFILLY